MVGNGVIPFGGKSLKSLNKSLGLTLNENVVNTFLKGLRVFIIIVSVRKTVMPAVTLIGKIGSDVMCVAVTACYSRLNSRRVVNVVEVSRYNCGAIILLAEFFNTVYHKIYLVSSCLAGVRTVATLALNSAHPPKVSCSEDDSLAAFLALEYANCKRLGVYVVKFSLITGNVSAPNLRGFS